MQKILFLVISLITGLFVSGQSLSGTVTDSATHQALDGAAVYFPKLKKGAVTDIKGNYKIASLPNGVYDVELHMTGYATISRQVTINGDAALDVSMAPSSASLKEIIITSLGNKMVIQRAPVPVTLVTHDMLLEQASTNVIDAIAKQPGITAITTGPGVSKPEINGLGYNRVLTLFDGERQEDFQWGDEHGVLIDPYAVYDAEIIRGPASLQYGANAVGGVVSFKSQPPAPGGTIQGSVQSEYQTNNGLIGNTIDINGNNNGFVWDVRGSYEAAHCYQDPHDGYVWGTAFDQSNVRALLRWNRKWGFSSLSVSLLHRQIEIPDGNRDSATGQFEFDVPLNAQYVNGQYVPGSGQIYPTKANFRSYDPDIAGYQVLDHDEVWWQNSINVGLGKIGVDIGYTQSIRHEIDTGNVGQENLIVHDIPYSIKYQVEDFSTGLKLTTGFNGMYEFENNYPEPPAPYVGDYEIPNYHLFDIGGYGILEKDFKNLTLSGGLRYDLRSITGQAMYLSNYDTPQQQQVPAGTPGAYTQFPPFGQTYTGFSGSIGATYQLPKNNYVKLNLARSYRAPAINELTANELDPSNVYKIGNPDLKAEQGYEADVAYGNNGRDVNFEVDGFYNYVNNFIFADRLASASGGDSMQLGAPVYKYTGENIAIIAGVTAYLNIHPASIKWFELDNGFTYIYSFLPGQTDSTQHVPFTPAPRLTSAIKFKLADKRSSAFRGTYFEFGLEHDWPQNNIYSALYNELPSFAYTLFNAGIGTNFVNKKTNRIVCSVILNCTNLMNLAYVDHTSRTQYFWAYNGVNDPTNFGVNAAVVTKQSEGIYNMGRNVGFKVIFPIGVAKTKAPAANLDVQDKLKAM
jgi:iron complex outermembrane receptor protein